MEILITICARGGSKGIKNKNIKLINGKSLIFYSLKTAEILKQKSKYNVDTVLSTDSKKIKSIVTDFDFNIETDYVRPDLLAKDNVGKIAVIKDVKHYMENKSDKKYDYILDLDVTSPLRSINDLQKSFDIIHNNKDAYNLFSVNNAERNPYFNMVEKDIDGFYKLCKKSDCLTRQSAPTVYELNASFYWYKKIFFKKNFKSAITDKSLIYVMNHICFDLDNPIDFDFMEYLLINNKLDFNF